jgi:hypothetical protein
MKFFVVDALHFEARWEAEMAVWKGTTAKNVDLWLDRQCRTFRNAEEVDAVVTCKEGVVTMGKTARCFFGIETSRRNG